MPPKLPFLVVAGLALSCTPLRREVAQIDYINPDGLHKNPAFSQVATVRGPVQTVFVGGQNAVDVAGEIVGPRDVAAQAQQVARNLQTALAAAGAQPAHIVNWKVYMVQGAPVGPAMQAFQQTLGPLPHAPTISVLFVAQLAHPDFLLEVEATAVVPLEPAEPRRN